MTPEVQTLLSFHGGEVTTVQGLILTRTMRVKINLCTVVTSPP